MHVRLRDITVDDLGLYEAQMTDPAMMAELGGPRPREGLEEKLRGIVEDVQVGRTLYSVIVVGDSIPAGSVCIWEHEWNGQTISEMGWMVLTDFQGRGLATAAVRALLDRARSEGRWGTVHAFPGVANGPSNAICRKTGFALVEEVDVVGPGGTLRCNHWVVGV
jgi:RimJ/RimL family protein N-acetyltransferase